MWLQVNRSLPLFVLGYFVFLLFQIWVLLLWRLWVRASSSRVPDPVNSIMETRIPGVFPSQGEVNWSNEFFAKKMDFRDKEQMVFHSTSQVKGETVMVIQPDDVKEDLKKCEELVIGCLICRQEIAIYVDSEYC